MGKFDQAFNNFKKTGCFILTNASLTFLQLIQLQSYLEKNIKLDNSNRKSSAETLPDYQFHLSNVELISGYVSMQTLTGAINEHSIAYNESIPDLHILSLSTKSQEHMFLRITEEERNLIRERTTFEKKLLTLLCQERIWHTIKLHKIMFSYRAERSKLSNDFFSELLEWLSSYTDTLRDFGFTLPTYITQSKLLTFLNSNIKIETLHLKLNYFHPYFQSLCRIISVHPSLKLLDLTGSELRVSDYHILSTVLDKNYRIKILVSEPNNLVPSNSGLLQQHNELLQRLSKSGIERFKEEQLTQAKLIKIAVQALEKGQNECFKSLLNLHTELTAITSHIELEKVCKSFPAVYEAHADYVKRYASDFQLNLHAPLVQNKLRTVGYHLLEKAFAVKDGESIVCLLKAGVNLLEHTEQDNTLIRSLSVNFEDSICPYWKKVVILFFQKDLSILILATRHLLLFESMYPPSNQIKQLLNLYLTKLKERVGWPSFLHLISDISLHLQDRKREWKRAFETLAYAIDVDTDKGVEIAYEMMDVLHEWVKRLMVETDLAHRGWLGNSKLNDRLKHLGMELESEINKCLKELHVREVAQSVQKWSQKQEYKIRELEENRRLDGARYIKDKEEIEARAKEREEMLKKEMEGKLKEQEEKINQLIQSMERMKNSLASASSNQSKLSKSEENSTQKEETFFFSNISGKR
ncbi:MAG: hypothetical protein AAGB33_00170 [Cellulomonas sp.]|nr:hypothetical protein [Rickettsiella sp.]